MNWIDGKKVNEIVCFLLSIIYDGEKKICNIIENIDKQKKNN